MEREQPVFMEQLEINHGSGQNFGYIVYRKKNQVLDSSSQLSIDGQINGAAMVVVDNVLMSPPLESTDDFQNFGYWCTE